MGRLDVRVVEARNLADTQWISKPDPYVIISLENQRHKTNVKDNDTNPKWDEVFKFTVADENSSQLRMELWNKNVVNDELLGMYVLSIANLKRGIDKDEWYLLQRSKTNAELRVRICALDFGDLPSAAETAVAGGQPAPQAPHAFPPLQQIPQQQQGYPPQQQGYPPQQQGYPPQQQQGYPPQQQQGLQGSHTCRVVLGSAHGKNLSANPQAQMTLSPNSQAWEQFTMENYGGQIVFRTAHNSFLSADPNTTASLAPHAQAWEKWVVIPHPSEHGKVAIRSAHNTFLRVSPDGKVDLAPQAQGWEAWTICPIGVVILGSAHGKNLSANPQAQMSLSPNSQAWEQFTMENHGGQIVIRTAHNSFLSADPNTTASLAPHAQAWEKWIVTPHPSEQGKFAIRSAHNTFLRVSPDGKVDLAPQAQGWEAWTVRNV